MEIASTDMAGAGEPEDDFRLADLMTVDQAVEQFPIFRRPELLAAIRAGELRHWRRGRQRFVTERWLRDWIRPQLRGGDRNAACKESATDTEDRRGRGGLPVRTTTPDEEEVHARLLSEAITRKPRKSTPQPR